MGVLDQAARYAAQADPAAVLVYVLRKVKAKLRFQKWVDTRLTPRPGQRDRTADRVAELTDDDDSTGRWLLVFEFQTKHDPDKLDVTLIEVAQLRLEVRHGDDRRGKYKVLVALIYLQGVCSESELDMTVSDGWGTKHAPLIWNVAEDNAAVAMDALAAGTMPWGVLFWIALMKGGDDPQVIVRWKEEAGRVENVRVRADLAGIALLFAELAGRRIVWADALKEWNMVESQLLQEWTAEACRVREMATRREDLLIALTTKFPDAVPEDILSLINQQNSLDLLRDWFRATMRASSLEEIAAVMRR